MTIDAVDDKFADGISLGDYSTSDGLYLVAVVMADTYPVGYKLGLLRPLPALRLALRLLYMSVMGLCFKK